MSYTSYSPYRPSGGGGFDREIGGVVAMTVMVVVVLLAFSAWLTFRALQLVVRAFAKEPRNPWLWSLLALVAALVAGAGLVAGHRGPPGVAAGLALAAGACLLLLLLAAAVVDLQHDLLLRPEPERLVTQVLRRPWWGEAT